LFRNKMSSQRKNLLEVPVDLCPLEELVFRIEQSIRNHFPRTVFAVNPEKIMFSRKDPELLSALKEADFLIPDGIGVILGLKFIYGRTAARVVRVTGIRLMRSLLDSADRLKRSVFLFGGAPEVNERAAAVISSRYPGLVLVGQEHGYISEDGYGDLVQKINSLDVDILFVGLGSPKQEKWIHRYKGRLNARICLGVGGSFDVLAGKASWAPRWIQQAGLEWLYRLFREPQRVKRQLALPQFALAVLKEKISRGGARDKC
jgi:N-acetylglucosaminyldiphosphoundecaprenol N-acetyl-beta-D-mannosaminyltransferase